MLRRRSRWRHDPRVLKCVHDGGGGGTARGVTGSARLSGVRLDHSQHKDESNSWPLAPAVSARYNQRARICNAGIFHGAVISLLLPPLGGSCRTCRREAGGFRRNTCTHEHAIKGEAGGEVGGRGKEA